MAEAESVWTLLPDGSRHIVSRCGLLCDTCPAFLHGICPGCPRLEVGDCVVRDCAHRKQVATCADCQLDSCYHFEAYRERREAVRQRTQAWLQRQGLPASAGQRRGCGGCSARKREGGGTGQGPAAAGGCGGCGALTRILAELEKVAAQG